jgi:uncharacterized membrane protein YgcG
MTADDIATHYRQHDLATRDQIPSSSSSSVPRRSLAEAAERSGILALAKGIPEIDDPDVVEWHKKLRLPDFCINCSYQHKDRCPLPCARCGQAGHKYLDCPRVQNDNKKGLTQLSDHVANRLVPEILRRASGSSSSSSTPGGKGRGNGRTGNGGRGGKGGRGNNGLSNRNADNSGPLSGIKRAINQISRANDNEGTEGDLDDAEDEDPAAAGGGAGADYPNTRSHKPK